MPNQRKNNQCHKGHEMTPENTKRRPSGYTQCRKCEQASAKQRRHLAKQRETTYSNHGVSEG